MKLISHRLHGLTQQPFGCDGIAAAARAGLDAVEIDTRVTADGVAVLQHDRWAPDFTGGWRAIDELTLSELRARIRSLLTLDEFLDCWRSQAPQSPCGPLELIIDLKSPVGVESQIEMVADAGLAKSTRFISWHPLAVQILARSPSVQHWGLSWMEAEGAPVRPALLALVHISALRRLAALAARPFNPVLALNLASGRFVRDFDPPAAGRRGDPAAEIPRDDFAVICPTRLPESLIAGAGGAGGSKPLACIPLPWIKTETVSRLREAGLQVAGYSAKTDKDMQRAARLGLDAVFLDDPSLAGESLDGKTTLGPA